MSRASSRALKHPPVTAPSEPAGALSPFPELAVAIDRERRRGRGAQSNESGRFEAEARVAFDDGWQSLDELPPFKTTVAVDTARKVIPATTPPISGLTVRSTLTGAASMAVSIVSRGRPTLFSACRPGWISNRNCSPSPTRRSFWKRNWRRRITNRA